MTNFLFLLLSDVDSNTIKNATDTFKEVAKFEIGDYFKFVGLLLAGAGIVILFLTLFYLKYNKDKNIEKKDNKEKDEKLFNALSVIPQLLKLFEKSVESLRESVFKMSAYSSQGHIELIAKRYIRGFLNFCVNIDDIQLVKEEFDDMIKDLSTEVVLSTEFIKYVNNNSVLMEIIEHVQNKTIRTAFYDLQKELEIIFSFAIQEAIRLDKKSTIIEGVN